VANGDLASTKVKIKKAGDHIEMKRKESFTRIKETDPSWTSAESAGGRSEPESLQAPSPRGGEIAWLLTQDIGSGKLTQEFSCWYSVK